jgi:hypothetical protein
MRGRKQEQMQDFLEVHLHYEINMTRAAHVFLHSKIADQYFFNIMLESFFLHGRTLIEFLRKDEKSVKPADFTDGSYTQARKLPSNSLLERINSQIGHIGLKRTTSADEKLSIGDADLLMNWIEMELVEFQSALAPSWAAHFVMPKPISTPESRRL